MVIVKKYGALKNRWKLALHFLVFEIYIFRYGSIDMDVSLKTLDRILHNSKSFKII